MSEVKCCQDHSLGNASEVFGAFPCGKAHFTDNQALVAVAYGSRADWHDAERLSVLGAGVAITIASTACWGALIAAVIILV